MILALETVHWTRTPYSWVEHLPTVSQCQRKGSEVKSLSRVRLFATPWTVAYQAPPSMGFSRQDYWSGLPFPSPGESCQHRDQTRSPALQADTLWSEPPEKRRRGQYIQDPCLP